MGRERERERLTDDKTLTCAVLVANKFQGLQWASWRHKGADGIVLVRFQRFDNQES